MTVPPVPCPPCSCPPSQVLNVPPALATHVTQELGKGLVLILNKVDLVPPAVATAWTHLLRRRVPAARVVPFTSAPQRAPLAGRDAGGTRGDAPVSHRHPSTHHCRSPRAAAAAQAGRGRLEPRTGTAAAAGGL